MENDKKGLESLYSATEPESTLREILLEQLVVADSNIRRVRNVTDSIQTKLDTHQENIQHDELLELRSDILLLKFIFADVFGGTGKDKDYIYQELKFEYELFK